MAGIQAVHFLMAALLVVAGVGKLYAPAPTSRALRAAGLPAPTVVVRGLGVVEVAVGGAVLVVGGRLPAVSLAAAYLVVTAVAVRQRRARADCGCFGSAASGVVTSALHIGVDAGAVVVAGFAAARDVGALPVMLPEGGVAVLALFVLGLAVVLLRSALIRLPELWAAQALHATEGRS